MAALSVALLAAALASTTPPSADPIDRWSDEIADASARFTIPAEWIRRVMRVESGGRRILNGQPIVSSAGAMGLMQLMPGTWTDMRARLGLGPDPYRPSDNILAGAAYLRLLYDRFGYPGLFAAYNAGPGRYAAAVSGRRRLPTQTRAYLAAMARPVAPAAAERPESRLFAVRTGRNAGSETSSLIPPVRSGGLFVTLTGSSGR